MSMTNSIRKAAAEAFTPGQFERGFQTAFQAELVRDGFFVLKTSDVPGRVNSTGYDLLVMGLTGSVRFVEVKRRNLTGIPSDFVRLLEPSQNALRLRVKAFGAPHTRYVLILLSSDRVTIKDVTDL